MGLYQSARELWGRINNHVPGTEEHRSWSAHKPRLSRRYAIPPLLMSAIAFILAFLCVYAGNTPSNMQGYAIFTLNTSRIGENLVGKLTDKIDDFDLGDIGLRKRAQPVILPVATITAAPMTMITLAPRDIFDDIGDGLEDSVDGVKSKANGAANNIKSKASSVESSLKSEATEFVDEAKEKLIKIIEKAYNSLIDDMNIKDFYNVHLRANCEGMYRFENGTEVPVGISDAPPPTGEDSVHQHVDSCKKHSAFDPTILIQSLYFVGIIFIGIAMTYNAYEVWEGPSKRASIIIGCLIAVAYSLVFLASLVCLAMALIARGAINLLGGELGIAAMLGPKFIALTWTTTGLLLFEVLVWIVFLIIIRHDKEDYRNDKKPSRRRTSSSSSGRYQGQVHEMQMSQSMQHPPMAYQQPSRGVGYNAPLPPPPSPPQQRYRSREVMDDDERSDI